MGLRAAAAVVLVLLGVLTACGDDEGDGSEGRVSAASAAPITERCDSGVPVDALVTTAVLGSGDLSLLAADFDVPEGVDPSDTVMVLLHQTGTLGLCGWGRFATEAAASGVRSLAVDLCGYGGSECADGEGTPAEQQVDLAAAHARAEMGADRVVLVGASMGGSRTVMAVAGGADVDAWADLSGPSTWDGPRWPTWPPTWRHEACRDWSPTLLTTRRPSTPPRRSWRRTPVPSSWTVTRGTATRC